MYQRFNLLPVEQNKENKRLLSVTPRLLTTRNLVRETRPPIIQTFQISGGENSLTEDLRLRPLANQWLAASHGIAASPWLPQNPFALHPAIPTSNAAFDPNHHPGVPIPGGFKFAQDSLTGQLLIIPSGGGFKTPRRRSNSVV